MTTDLIKECKKVGWTKNNGIKQVGFVLDNLGPNQIAYLAIYHTNNLINSSIGVNPTLFYLETCPPCLTSNALKLNVVNANSYTGDLIATSVSTALAIQSAARAKKYYYINDITFLNEKEFDRSDIKTILLDNNYVKFCRSEDHRKELIDIGYDIVNSIIKDFDMNAILEIVNGKKV